MHIYVVVRLITTELSHNEGHLVFEEKNNQWMGYEIHGNNS